MSKRITLAVFLVSIVLLAVIVNMVNGFGTKKDEIRKNVIGLILPGSISEDGWNGDHYRSVKSVTDELGSELVVMENVKEGSGQVANAAKSLVEAGAGMIILCSYNFPGEMENYIKEQRDVSFYGISNELDLKNFTAYSARVYQARYLAGVIAGLNTRTNKLGYVAAMNNSEVNRGINAFALGARRVNPKVKVYVAWSNSWDNVSVERENVNKLVKDAGVDVLGYHQNRTHVLEEAEAQGVMSVAYSLKASPYSPNVLGSTATNWSMVYKEIIQDYLQKKHSVNNYWVGADKNAIEVPFLSDAVSDSAKQVVGGLLDSLKNGMDVFAGPVYDNHRKKRCDKNEVISDIILRGEMDWFVDGVMVYENQ